MFANKLKSLFTCYSYFKNNEIKADGTRQLKLSYFYYLKNILPPSPTTEDAFALDPHPFPQPLRISVFFQLGWVPSGKNI